jgi:hypothetical protein
MVNNYNGATSIAIGNFSGTGGFSDSVAIGRGVKNSSACEMNLGNVLKLCNIYKCDMQSSAFMTGATVDAGCNIFKAGNIILAYTTVPPSPVAGQIYFNGTNFFGYNGITWKQLDN